MVLNVPLCSIAEAMAFFRRQLESQHSQLCKVDNVIIECLPPKVDGAVIRITYILELHETQAH